MVPVSRHPSPPELTSDVVSELTDIFKITGDSVWNQNYIRNRLLEMSFGKCVYCETKVDEESKYMEVDHFLCKAFHPDDVVAWDNLLPSCKRCNVNKGAHDAAVVPLIDPTTDVPRNHILLRNYRLIGKDKKGRDTISEIYLNDSLRVVKKRYDLGNRILDVLESLREDMENFIRGPQTSRLRNRVVRGLKGLLAEASPSSEFGATAASVMLSSEDFLWLKDRLAYYQLWDSEFDQRFLLSASIVLSEPVT